MSSKVWTSTELLEKLQSISVDNPLCTYTKERCERLTPQINDILKLKEEKDALILAHSYVHPDIIYGVADHVGDSYFLAKMALESKQDTIVFPAVRFMAETAKILNPDKLVIDPNPNGGCSLADSITKEQVLRLREKYPDYTFLCYVNTTAAVKAACDVCVTSSNVYKIAKDVPNDKIVFLPDRLMGENVINYLRENNIPKHVILHTGTCYVHEEFTVEEVDMIRAQRPETKVLAHPECKQEVVQKADVIGSTGQITKYVDEHQNDGNPFLILTECGIASRLQVEHPQVEIVGSCMMCKYMKSNSLDNLRKALKNPQKSQIVEIPEADIEGAKKTLDAMFYYTNL
jgi:quinolinate synthase